MTIPPNTFKAYYNTLNLDDKLNFIAQVCQAFEISESTFYRRINMPWLYNPTEREKLAEIAGLSAELLFSPETINQPA